MKYIVTFVDDSEATPKLRCRMFHDEGTRDAFVRVLQSLFIEYNARTYTM